MRQINHHPSPAVSDWYTEEKNRKRQADRSGLALKRHCDNAHRGEVDPKCNACIELQRDMNAAKEMELAK